MHRTGTRRASRRGDGRAADAARRLARASIEGKLQYFCATPHQVAARAPARGPALRPPSA
ncbi:hypothetical protein EFP18_15325 [Burkholderia glumae]|nr:hypothetical protein NCPPB3923_28265 [Burkholderia glumae]PJO22968.1 hypothetical protein Y5A_011230 [Burkholderia glumae AU6208]RQZ75557.1 hypothetical protein DF052_03925 [Burkholderia glumae]UVS85349.1 hypothetical protein EFP18_15325 [Burkholderia glumae]UVS91266.1 hypothetical protein EFP17_16710 [Burkholderia glumae]